jgi:anti-sigma factor RsiW
MSCKVELLESLLDGELSPSAAGAVDRHAEECVGCARELAWLKAERALMAQRAERMAAPEELWERIASAGAPVLEPTATVSKAPRRPWRERAGAWSMAAAALAAAVLLVATRVDSPVPAPPTMAVAAIDSAGWVEQLYGACLIAFPKDSLWCAEDAHARSEPLASFSFSR